jgi:hypothetical protein
MPVLTDIMEHDLPGMAIRQGLVWNKGARKGAREEALDLLARLVTKRFGSVPAPVKARLAKCSADELEDLAVRMVDAKSIEDLLRYPAHTPRNSSVLKYRSIRSGKTLTTAASGPSRFAISTAAR